MFRFNFSSSARPFPLPENRVDLRCWLYSRQDKLSDDTGRSAGQFFKSLPVQIAARPKTFLNNPKCKEDIMVQEKSPIEGNERRGLHAHNPHRAAWFVSVVLVFMCITESFAQNKFKEEIFEWLSHALQGGPPPTLQDLKSIWNKAQGLFSEKDRHFPIGGRGIYKLGHLYSIPRDNSTVAFYNEQQNVVVAMPPGAYIGLKKAISHLKGEGWSAAKISAWLLPVATYYSSRMVNTNDCYIYESQNGFVRIKYEGNSSPGRWLSVKIITEEPVLKEYMKPENAKPYLPLSPLWLPCLRFDKYNEYWHGSFDL